MILIGKGGFGQEDGLTEISLTVDGGPKKNTLQRPRSTVGYPPSIMRISTYWGPKNAIIVL